MASFRHLNNLSLVYPNQDDIFFDQTEERQHVNHYNVSRNCFQLEVPRWVEKTDQYHNQVESTPSKHQSLSVMASSHGHHSDPIDESSPLPCTDTNLPIWGQFPGTHPSYTYSNVDVGEISSMGSTVDEQSVQDFESPPDDNIWTRLEVKQEDAWSNISSRASYTPENSDNGNNNHAECISIQHTHALSNIDPEILSSSHGRAAWEPQSFNENGQLSAKPESSHDKPIIAFQLEQQSLPDLNKNTAKPTIVEEGSSTKFIALPEARRQIARKAKSSATFGPPRRRRKQKSTRRETHNATQSCPDHPEKTFKTDSAYRKHIRAVHIRPFVCLFRANGCTASFGSKNEWKRHIQIQHFRLGYWACRICRVPDGHTFNRKDLFAQHLRRVHLPKKSTGRSSSSSSSVKKGRSSLTESDIPSLQESCLVNIRKAPERSTCGFCGEIFIGRDSWDVSLEHVGHHLENGWNIVHWKEDEIVRDWLIRQGLVERVQNYTDSGFSWVFKNKKAAKNNQPSTPSISNEGDEWDENEDAEGEEE